MVVLVSETRRRGEKFSLVKKMKKKWCVWLWMIPQDMSVTARCNVAGKTLLLFRGDECDEVHIIKREGGEFGNFRCDFW